MSFETIAIGFFVIVFLVFVFIYNNFISKRNSVRNAFASLDAMLKKRFDLIPNLVTVVEKYMNYERETLQKITELRAKAISPDTPYSEKLQLNDQISKFLRQIIAVAENYPVLKASENFMHLQRSLNEVEEQIAASRRAYNAAVTDYNNYVQMFPFNIVAKIFGFKPESWFEIPEEERKPVVIK